MAGEKTPRERLDDLGVAHSDSRNELDHKSKSDAIAALRRWGIEVKDESVIPDPVTLPPPGKVKHYIQLAEAYDLLGAPEEAAHMTDYLILMCVVGAIPFVAADPHGSG